jgi:signal transduction histidine kinase
MTSAEAAPPTGPSEERIRRLFWVNVAVTLVGVAVAISTWESSEWGSVELILVLTAFGVASELLAYGTRHVWLVASSAPHVLAMTLVGPAPTIAIAFVALIAAAINERAPRENFMANLASYVGFSVTGGLLCRSIIERFDLTPAEPEFGILIVAAYAFISVFTIAMMVMYDYLTLNRAAKRDRIAVVGQAIAEAPTALITAGAVLIYGRAGVWGLSGLVVVQVFYSYLVRQLAQSEQREKELQRNRAERGRLVGEVSTARDRERIRLAAALHDESLQNLYALRQEVTALPEPDSRARATAAVDRTIAQLRGEILDLNPAVLESAGLADAVSALAKAVGKRAGFRTELTVDSSAAGVHDRLLLELVREQLMNAAKHAQPRTVQISIGRSNGLITMQVSDDGRGIPDGRLQAAITEGHIGLAASEERVVAVGGSLSVESCTRSGTLVTTKLPVQGGGGQPLE